MIIAVGKQSSISHVLREIVTKGGVRSLYAGLNATILRALPVNIVTFPVYEAVSNRLSNLGM